MAFESFLLIIYFQACLCSIYIVWFTTVSYCTYIFNCLNFFENIWFEWNSTIKYVYSINCQVLWEHNGRVPRAGKLFIIHVLFQICFKSEKQAKTSCTFCLNLEQNLLEKGFFSKTHCSGTFDTVLRAGCNSHLTLKTYWRHELPVG